MLSQKLRGHYAYYGITGNSYLLSRFRDDVAASGTSGWFVAVAAIADLGVGSTGFSSGTALPPAVSVHSTCRLRSERIT